MSEKASIVLRDYPTSIWLIGGLFAAGLGYYYTQSGQTWALEVSLGVLISTLLFPSIITVRVDRSLGVLTLAWRSLLRRKTREIPMSDILDVQVQSQVSYDEGRKSTTYRLVFLLKDGEVIPLRSFYSSGYLSKMAQAERLRNSIGLGETSPFAQATQEAEKMFREEQASLPGIPQEEQVTGKVRWQVETKAFGGTPITRWHSPQVTFPEGFLYLVQKFSGQKTNSGGLMGALAKTLLQGSLKIYAFSAEEAPNSASATLLSPLPASIEAHYIAFTTDAGRASQMLNAWTCIPLANWAQRYPMNQGSQNQLAVLYSPKGLYLSVIGLVNSEFLEEMTNLGVDLVRAQGSNNN